VVPANQDLDAGKTPEPKPRILVGVGKHHVAEVDHHVPVMDHLEPLLEDTSFVIRRPQLLIDELLVSPVCIGDAPTLHVRISYGRLFPTRRNFADRVNCLNSYSRVDADDLPEYRS
jgi:hypothetical protein